MISDTWLDRILTRLNSLVVAPWWRTFLGYAYREICYLQPVMWVWDEYGAK